MMKINESANYISVVLKLSQLLLHHLILVDHSTLSSLANAFALSAPKVLNDLMIKRARFKSPDNKNPNLILIWINFFAQMMIINESANYFLVVLKAISIITVAYATLPPSWSEHPRHFG
jgi:hypothetical protein